MQVKKQQLELDMEQQTGSKSGKEYIKAVYCHPVYLTYMQSTSCEMSTIVQQFEHSLALTFFGIRMKTDLVESLWPLLNFPNLLAH